MEKVTSVKLGHHFDGLIADLTEKGRFNNASEALRAGLRLLEREEQEYQIKLEALRQMVIDGDNSDESDSTIDEIFAEVKAEMNAR